MSKINCYDRFNRPKDPGLKCDPAEGKTHQSFKDECDINNIVGMYVKTGEWGRPIRSNAPSPMFGDFTNAPDFRGAMERILQAQEDFDGLPAIVRKRFNNDPAELLAFIADDKNYDEAVSLGIVKKPDTPAAATPAAGVSEVKA